MRGLNRQGWVHWHYCSRPSFNNAHSSLHRRLGKALRGYYFDRRIQKADA